MYLIYTFELVIYWFRVFILYALMICTCSRVAKLNDKLLEDREREGRYRKMLTHFLD